MYQYSRGTLLSSPMLDNWQNQVKLKLNWDSTEADQACVTAAWEEEASTWSTDKQAYGSLTIPSIEVGQ